MSQPFFPSGLPGDALLLAESPDTVAFCNLGDAPDPDHPWSRADVFTADWNLRMCRMGARIKTVAIGGVPGMSSWGEPEAQESLSDASAQESRVVLWGRKNAGESMWLELRVPHLMTPENHLHPGGQEAAQDGGMARRYLTLIRYEEEGMARCYRYTGLAYAQVNEDDSTFQPAQSA